GRSASRSRTTQVTGSTSGTPAIRRAWARARSSCGGPERPPDPPLWGHDRSRGGAEATPRRCSTTYRGQPLGRGGAILPGNDAERSTWECDMRFKSKIVDGFQVFAVAGPNTVSFGITATATAKKRLLGFGVKRGPKDKQLITMRGFKVFKSIIP